MSTFRTRSTDLRTDTKIRTRTWNPGQSSPYEDYYSTYAKARGSNKTMTDYVFTGYKQRRSHGEIMMGDLSTVLSERTSTDNTLTVGPHANWGTMIKEGDLSKLIEGTISLSSYRFNSSYIDRMKAFVLINAYAKMNKAPIDGGEFLATFSQTLGMLKRPLGKSRDLIQKMIKYRKIHQGKTVATFTKATANAWLEYRYGWQPLLIDGQQIVKEVHDYVDRKGKVVERKVARASEGFEDSTSKTTDTTFGAWRYRGTRTGQKKVRCSAGVIYDVNCQMASDAVLASSGLRGRDLTGSVWELIPFSFVADWFVNVGDWLQAVMPVPYINVKGSWRTTVTEEMIDLIGGQLFYTISVAPVSTYTTSCGSQIKNLSVVREAGPVVANLPVVTTKPLSPLHSVDALSLLAANVISDIKDFRRHS